LEGGREEKEESGKRSAKVSKAQNSLNEKTKPARSTKRHRCGGSPKLMQANLTGGLEVAHTSN
jgi:hypothetical protein